MTSRTSTFLQLEASMDIIKFIRQTYEMKIQVALMHLIMSKPVFPLNFIIADFFLYNHLAARQLAWCIWANESKQMQKVNCSK